MRRLSVQNRESLQMEGHRLGGSHPPTVGADHFGQQFVAAAVDVLQFELDTATACRGFAVQQDPNLVAGT